MAIFTVCVRNGREIEIANAIIRKAKILNLDIQSVVATPRTKGYVYVESNGPHTVRMILNEGIRHVKTLLEGTVSIDELKKFLIEQSNIKFINISDEVEIIAGPFKGMKASVKEKDLKKDEVTVELLEANFTMPVTLHGNFVRLFKRAEAINV